MRDWLERLINARTSGREGRIRLMRRETPDLAGPLRFRLQLLKREQEVLLEAMAGQVMPIQVGVARGLQWRLYPGYPVRFAWGVEDFVFQEVLKTILRPGDVFYDVGANAGFHTLVGATLVGKTGRVFAFEPLRANVNVLRDQLALNELDQCEVLEVAVGDRVGETTFFQHDQLGLGSTASTQPSHRVTPVDVSCTTLDAFAAGHLRPHAVKIDVEGAEHYVLAGAEEMLKRDDAPVLMIELHTPQAAVDVGKRLASSNYGVFVAAREPSAARVDVPRLSTSNICHIVAARDGDERVQEGQSVSYFNLEHGPSDARLWRVPLGSATETRAVAAARG